MVLDIFKRVFEEIINYYNNDCLKDQTINNDNFKIEYDENKLKELDSENELESILNSVIHKVNDLRQENQSQLEDEKFDVKIFAKNEVILSSANVAFESLSECFKNINYLTRQKHGEKVLDINEDFAIQKISSLASNILSRYEHLPTRLKKNSELSKIIEVLKQITSTNEIENILQLSKDILLNYNKILHLDNFVDYDVLVEEYGWVHDVVKLSRVSAGVIGWLVNADIYIGVLSKKYYKVQKSAA
ncbi:hypothetical protein [Spiroplasma tabanidicola]|uniref:Uncharacterized protein n=1 Tax=Spiroplasma tabanidicola TaxID=324079 RepID=A0A6I6C5X9_9MOLU|nr:hypothetical protein [Spiroplasma tabanidicola]QGS52307.1 hypothetical protein STABA_v1c09540 [Spiroplasma tabanidicola]